MTTLVDAPPDLTGIVGELRCYHTNGKKVYENCLQGSPDNTTWSASTWTGITLQYQIFLSAAFAVNKATDKTAILLLENHDSQHYERRLEQGSTEWTAPVPINDESSDDLGFSVMTSVLEAGKLGKYDQWAFVCNQHSVYELHRQSWNGSDPELWDSTKIFEPNGTTDNGIYSVASCVNQDGMWAFISTNVNIYLLFRKHGSSSDEYTGANKPWACHDGGVIGAVSAWSGVPKVYVRRSPGTIWEASPTKDGASGFLDILAGTADREKSVYFASVAHQKESRTMDGGLRPETITVAYTVENEIHTRVWTADSKKWNAGPVVCDMTQDPSE